MFAIQHNGRVVTGVDPTSFGDGVPAWGVSAPMLFESAESAQQWFTTRTTWQTPTIIEWRSTIDEVVARIGRPEGPPTNIRESAGIDGADDEHAHLVSSRFFATDWPNENENIRIQIGADGRVYYAVRETFDEDDSTTAFVVDDEAQFIAYCDTQVVMTTHAQWEAFREDWPVESVAPHPPPPPPPPEFDEITRLANLSIAAADFASWWHAIAAIVARTRLPEWESLGRTERFRVHHSNELDRVRPRYEYVSGHESYDRSGSGRDSTHRVAVSSREVPAGDDAYEYKFVVGTGGHDGEYRMPRAARTIADYATRELGRALRASSTFVAELPYGAIRVEDREVAQAIEDATPPRSRRWRPRAEVLAILRTTLP